MLDIHALLKNYRPKLSENSIRVYLSYLKNLIPVSKINTPEELGKYIVDNLDSLLSTIEQIESPSTQVGKLNTLIVFAMGLLGEKSHEYIKLSELRDKANNKYKKNTEQKSEKYTQNEISEEQYTKLLEKLENKAMVLMKAKTSNWSETQDIQRWVVLLVYQHHAFRSDLSPMGIYHGKTLPTEESNFLWVKSPRKMCFVMKQFKTKSTYEMVVIDVHKSIVTRMNKYIKYVETVRPDNLSLLVNKNNSPLSSASLGILFSSVFKQEYGKMFTITLNRKRVVSNDPAVQKLMENQKQVDKQAKEMMTSSQMLMQVYNQTGKSKKNTQN